MTASAIPHRTEVTSEQPEIPTLIKTLGNFLGQGQEGEAPALKLLLVLIIF